MILLAYLVLALMGFAAGYGVAVTWPLRPVRVPRPVPNAPSIYCVVVDGERVGDVTTNKLRGIALIKTKKAQGADCRLVLYRAISEVRTEV